MGPGVVIGTFSVLVPAAIAGATAKPAAIAVRDTEKGLKISVSVAKASVSASEPLLATVVLRNVSAQPLTVRSHIKTHETHLDWYRFRLEYLVPDAAGRCDAAHARRAAREIAITDSRDKSYPVDKTLAPGESITHTVDLQAWASRGWNGSARIPPGLYTVTVAYEIPSKERQFFKTGPLPLWTGSVEAFAVPVTVAGSVPRDRCGPGPG